MPPGPLLATLLFLTMVPSLSALEIIAHRGASLDAPENTLAAFRLGWEQKSDGNELDIRLTQDGEVIVCHDATTKRTAGVDKPIVQQTYAELRALDAGSWKGSKWKGEKLPSLPEAIATIPEGKVLFIEIKCGVEILPALEKIVQESGKKPEQLALISFGYEVIAAAKERMPQFAAYWIVGRKKEKYEEDPHLDQLLTRAKAAHLDGLDLQGTFPIDRAFTDKVKAAGMKLYTWTVDDAALAKRLAEAGVDGITTNRPGWLREKLGL